MTSNIRMSVNTDTGYEVLHPETTVEQVIDPNTNKKLNEILVDANTTTKGLVQLTDDATSTSITTAATPKSVKVVNDKVITLETDTTAHKEDDTGHVRFGVDTGTANAKVVVLNPAPTKFLKGLALSFENLLTNTGPVTLELNDNGIVPVEKPGGRALSAGDFKAGGIYNVRYNGTVFMLQGEGGDGLSDMEMSTAVTSLHGILNA